MSEQNQPGESQETWDPYKSFKDSVGSADEPSQTESTVSFDSAGTSHDTDPASTTEAAPTASVADEAPATDPYGQPSNYGQAGAQSAPSAPQYGQHPQQGFGQPQQQPYASPAPYGAGQFGGQMVPGWNDGPTESGASTVTLNYWLSVFFSWIPALIFYLTEKDKNALVAEHVKENLNFQITRIIVAAVMIIPLIGWVVGGIATLVLFVVAILGAMQGPDTYRRGQVYKFPLAIRLIK